MPVAFTETMSLEEFLDEEEKDPSDGYCPNCEKLGELTEYWYNRCTNSSCEVITFIPWTENVKYVVVS